MKKYSDIIFDVQKSIRKLLFDLKFEDYDKAIDLIKPLEDYFGIRIYDEHIKEDIEEIKMNIIPKHINMLKNIRDNIITVKNIDELNKDRDFGYLLDNDLITVDFNSSHETVIIMINWKGHEILRG